MAFNVALNFEDGVTRFIACGPDETVADASFRAGVNIPMDCRDGACGTCKCRAESGDFDAGTYIEDALTEQEFTQGYALACQIRQHSDLVISIAASSAACRIKSQSVPTTLTASALSGIAEPLRFKTAILVRERAGCSATSRFRVSPTPWCRSSPDRCRIP
jgi:ferredoxin